MSSVIAEKGDYVIIVRMASNFGFVHAKVIRVSGAIAGNRG